MKPLITDFHSIRLEFRSGIEEIAQRGPESTDYPFLIAFYDAFSQVRRLNRLTEANHAEALGWFGESVNTLKTLQGHVRLKPHGYDGDYEIIDKIYRTETSTAKVFRQWDEFFQSRAATKAVRNRKEVFKSILSELPFGAKILNLACGPCRDILEFFQNNGKSLEIYNIDYDKNAISFGSELLASWVNKNIFFQQANILRYKPNEKYDLVWSAGLFDYFDDRIFRHLIDRFWENVKRSGSFIIGNFSPFNPTRPFMEFGNWFLHHRDEDKLLSLCSNIKNANAEIFKEAEGVNLFLKLVK